MDINPSRLEYATHHDLSAPVAQEITRLWDDEVTARAIRGNEGTAQLPMGARIGLARTVLLHNAVFAALHPRSLHAAATLLLWILGQPGAYAPALGDWLQTHKLEPASFILAEADA